MKSKSGMKCIVLLAPLVFLLSTTVCMAAAAKIVKSGTKWEVAKTITLTELTIDKDAAVTVPAGHSLTMTVNGVETPPRAGTYRGHIVLTPSKAIVLHYSGMGTNQNYHFRTAVYIDNGVYLPQDSVPAAAVGGKVTSTFADNVKVTSVGPLFAAFMIRGNSSYTIKNPVIHMIGNGKNDFFGYGASIRVGGNSKVTIDGAKINNTGVVRTAVWVGDHANVTVNNANIEVHNGILPKDYGWSWAKGGPTGNGDVMMQVPWMLGLLGNNRATLAVGHGTVTYNHSHIRAQEWGAMSTDAVQEVRVNLNKCHVETVKSGYGAYGDGNSMIYSSGTTFDVADYGTILAGGSAVFTNGSVVNSRRIGIMDWGGSKGAITIKKGSVFNTAKADIQLKSASPDILIDDARLHSKTGILLEMFPNDDPNQKGGGPSGGGRGAGGPGAGGPGARGAAGGPKSAAGHGGPGGPPGAGGMKNAKYSTTHSTNDQFTTIKNTTLKGDFVNALTKRSAMNISLENATVTGAITTATSVHAVGRHGEKLVMQDAPTLYYLIGEVNMTYAPTTTAHGATVKLDGTSKWYVAKTSYLTGLTIAPGAKVAAPRGDKLTMIVNGAPTPIAAGSYTGKIVMRVVASR